MGGFSGKPRANHEGGPCGVFFKKSTESFEEKGQVLLVRFPSTYGDNLIFFLDGGIKLKDIGLNRVRNTVDFGGIDSQAGGEGFPEISGMRGFDKNGGQEFQSFL
jgi:hypothetical protein